MLICFFARADHPLGWGLPQTDGYDSASQRWTLKDPSARAHGYSLLAVRCVDEQERDLVVSALAQQEFLGLPGSTQYPNGLLGAWFGGRFDYVACVSSEAEPAVTGPHPYPPAQRFFNFGDNRNFAIYEAAEVIGATCATARPVEAIPLTLEGTGAAKRLAAALVVSAAAALALLRRRRRR